MQNREGFSDFALFVTVTHLFGDSRFVRLRWRLRLDPLKLRRRTGAGEIHSPTVQSSLGSLFQNVLPLGVAS
jgi:hypothetical protein